MSFRLNIICLFRDSVLHAAGSFPAPGFRPARCGKLSSFAIPPCTLQEAFALRDSVLHAAGSFRAPRFRPARCRKLSRSAIPSCTLREAFALRDSVLHAAGSFRSSRFRPARCGKLSQQIIRPDRVAGAGSPPYNTGTTPLANGKDSPRLSSKARSFPCRRRCVPASYRASRSR